MWKYSGLYADGKLKSMLTSCRRQVIMDKLHLNQYAKLQLFYFSQNGKTGGFGVLQTESTATKLEGAFPKRKVRPQN